MSVLLNRRTVIASALTCLVFVAVPGFADPATSTATVINVGEMCGGCVKKINTKLNSFPGILKVSCDIPSKTVTVIPQAGTVISSKALWEAMEEIGKKPVKMIGPQGVFTEKPKA